MPDQAPSPATPVSTTLGAEPGLRLAEQSDVVQSLAFALRYQGRRRVDTAGQAMAQITAERLVEHLRLSGFVVMQRPPAPLAPDRQYGGGFRVD